MKTNVITQFRIQEVKKFFKKVISAIVSGFPENEELDRIRIRNEGPVRKQYSGEKRMHESYVHPLSNPLMKKMTLSKEKKKEKTHK